MQVLGFEIVHCFGGKNIICVNVLNMSDSSFRNADTALCITIQTKIKTNIAIF
jgi:hypothetical protein